MATNNITHVRHIGLGFVKGCVLCWIDWISLEEMFFGNAGDKGRSG